MLPGTLIDPAAEYEALAADVARRYAAPMQSAHALQRVIECGFLRAVYQDCPAIDDAECDPAAFAARVKEYQAGFAD